MSEFFKSIASVFISAYMAVTGFFSPIEEVPVLSAPEGYYYIDVERESGTEKLLVAKPNGVSGNFLDINEYQTTKLAVMRQMERRNDLGGENIGSGYIVEMVNSIEFMERHKGRLGASGSEVPIAVALFETSLASSISSSAESMTLVSATDKAGTTLASSTYAFILDEGSASEEFVIADCTSTACANMIRGLSPITGTTTVSSLQKSHRRGASVKITDAPQLLIISRIIQGRGFFQNLLRYASSVGACSNNDDICDKAYVDGVAVAGASDANETTKGIVEMATQLEIASSTSAGGTTAPMFIRNTYSTTTPDLSTNNRPNNYIPVSRSNGWLDENWFGNGIHIGTTTPFKGSTFGIEQNGTEHLFSVGDTGTSSPHFWITAKGDVRLATTTVSDKWQLAVGGTTTTDRFHMPTGKGSGKVLTSNSIGAGTWQNPPIAYSVSSSTTHSVTATGTIFGVYVPAGIIDGDSSVEIYITGNAAGGAYWQGLVVEIGTTSSTTVMSMGNFSQCSTYAAVLKISARNSQTSQIITGYGINSSGGSCGTSMNPYTRKTRTADLSSGDVLIRVRGGTTAGGAITSEQATLTVIP